MLGLNGGLVGASRNPNNYAAPGVWAPNEHIIHRRQGTWVNDPLFSSVSLLLHMNGSNASTTFADSSANAVTVTANGNAQISTAQSKYGGASGLFDGNGDNLQVASPSSSLVAWHNQNFTVEYWIRATAFAESSPTGAPVVVGNMTAGSTTNYWSFGPIANGTVRFYYFNGSVVTLTTAASLSTSTWHHLAFVKNSTALTIYIDGVASALGAVSGTPQSSTGTPFVVGQFNNTAYNGYIDDLRVTTAARYTGNFAVPSGPYPDF